MALNPQLGALIHTDQNGSREVYPSGTSQTVESGATHTFESGSTLAVDGTLSIGGTTVTATADELNGIDISAVGALAKVKKIAISAAPTGSEQDTTWDLPAKSVVLNVFVDVTTAEVTGTTKTLDVGLLSSESGGDADGFIDGVSVAATGLKLASLVSGSVTRGVLLKETVTGSGSATHSSPVPYASTANTAKSVSYTSGSNNFAEFRGAIYIVYVELG